MDISSLTLAELKNLAAAIPAEIAKREKEEKQKALKDLAALAAERGFSLDELVSGTSAPVKKQRAPVEIKYRNNETGETWSGRGRQPKWLEGKNKDDYKV